MDIKKSILVIDDNRMIRELLVSDLEEDYKVLVAAGGAEGLETAAKSHPDIILLDVNMPDMTGIEVIRQLYRQSETKDIPVVIITASEFNDATKAQLQPCGNFKGFLSKLTAAETIKELLQKVLNDNPR
ncbi:MAG: response regulator [Elusimicrobiota bacterium]|nr:response regulator [Elusimicrobiota bacterium]